MSRPDTLAKLAILADAAKYDVSCSSSGSQRATPKNGLGNGSASGICHSFTEDGRCVSLLKILLTNHCIYDCAYCVSRRSNDVARAAFTVEEVVDLTIQFYRRNYIEGLFLSSGIFKNADYTMERLVRIAQTLREQHHFGGYIHLKAIPKASPELLDAAARYADRLSINMEIPTQSGLKLLAPEKQHQDMIVPMQHLQQGIEAGREERKSSRRAPKYAPAGQSTQLIIGAAGETDRQIIRLASHFYRDLSLKRVYYSGYVPVSNDARLPALQTAVPVLREHRLYQADWLMRFYGFAAEEIVDSQSPFLSLDFDPKLAWALRHRHFFPVRLQSAPLASILRVPGIGVKSARKIIHARRFRPLSMAHLRAMGVALNRARYFIEVAERNGDLHYLHSDQLPQLLYNTTKRRQAQTAPEQGVLF